MQGGGKTAKLRKAEELAARGQPIEIIGEEDFLKLQKQGYTEEYEALITKYLMEIKK